MDTPKNGKLTVGKPSNPLWNKKGYYFLGWMLLNKEGTPVSGVPTTTNGRQYYDNHNGAEKKFYYINTRYVSNMCVNGCTKQGYYFKVIKKGMEE